MAKILETGDHSKQHKPWIGEKLKCGNCACEFELEEDDDNKVTDRVEGRVMASYFVIECPKCSTYIEFNPRIRNLMIG